MVLCSNTCSLVSHFCAQMYQPAPQLSWCTWISDLYVHMAMGGVTSCIVMRGDESGCAPRISYRGLLCKLATMAFVVTPLNTSKSSSMSHIVLLDGSCHSKPPTVVSFHGKGVKRIGTSREPTHRPVHDVRRIYTTDARRRLSEHRVLSHGTYALGQLSVSSMGKCPRTPKPFLRTSTAFCPRRPASSSAPVSGVIGSYCVDS